LPQVEFGKDNLQAGQSAALIEGFGHACARRQNDIISNTHDCAYRNTGRVADHGLPERNRHSCPCSPSGSDHNRREARDWSAAYLYWKTAASWATGYKPGK
jgi:hypothetical protein